MLTLAKSTELQNVVVPGKKGRGWDDLLTHPECQRLYKGKDFVVTLRVKIPGQEIKIQDPNFATGITMELAF